jgi:class 3 adenylate cyclase
VERPEIQYVAVGDTDVAYQVIGDGPIDLLFFWSLGFHLELVWEAPLAAELLKRLASFSRLIIFDRRGTGASDGFPRRAFPTWEEWSEDLLAVLDAVGSTRSAIFATLDSGAIATLFAAIHPERVSALTLLTTTAQYLADDDYPIGAAPEAVEMLVDVIETQWGTTELARLTNPSMADDTEDLEMVARMMRSSATPRSAADQFRYICESAGVRDVLPVIEVPTLVMHVAQHPFIPAEHGRYLADHIKNAKFVLLPGADGGMTRQNGVFVDEIAEFVTGERPVAEVERVLTTVLFSDIVGSTATAASLGDRRWRSLLDSHDRTVRALLRQSRGREINTTGDGFVASFDGPARAIRCAQALLEATDGLGLQLRVGLHTGECEVRGDDLGGLAVHIAARVGALASPGEVLVSGTVKDLVVGSGIEFEDRGEHELKGVPGAWKLFAVRG